MATARARNITYVPGRLIKDPTDLSAAFPYGGTPLGLTHKHAFRPGDRLARVVAEEFSQTVEGIYWAQSAVFACFLREWDPDAIVTIFPGASLGGSGRPIAAHSTTQTVRTGSTLSDRAHALLFAPLSPGTAPATLIKLAMPTPDEAAEMQLSPASEIGLAVRWEALPDSSGDAYQQGLLEDLSL